MEEMGEFILLSAQAKAEEKGVDVEGVVRKGNVGEEIITLAKDLNADYVVLGQPRGEEGSDVFTHNRLTQFGERIEEESGAKIIMVGAGEV
jgi:nucleotide-binding universal stress UspA family protein